MRPILTGLAAAVLSLALALPAPAATTVDPGAVPAGTYKLDRKHASLVVQVRHMGLTNYTMRFNTFDAHFDYDPKDPTAARVEATVNLASLDTGDPDYGAQFARQFLDVEHHPVATFVSTGLTKIDDAHGKMTGDLTLRGVTLPVTLDVVFDGYSATLVGGERAGFSARGQIDRTAFGSKFLSPGIVSDYVDVIIEAEFLRQ